MFIEYWRRKICRYELDSDTECEFVQSWIMLSYVRDNRSSRRSGKHNMIRLATC